QMFSCWTSRQTISTFQRWKYWRKACWNFGDRSFWSLTTVTCLTACRTSSSASTAREARSPLPITHSGGLGSPSALPQQIVLPEQRNQHRWYRHLQAKRSSPSEAREYAGIEQQIAEAEQVVRQRRAELEDPAIASNA